MTKAIAAAMGNSALADYIALNFTEVDIRRSQRGVLVDVGLRDYQGSIAALTSSLTEDNINTQMLSLGLRSVQLVVGSPIMTSSIANKSSSVPEKSGSTDSSTASTIVIVVCVGVGVLILIAGCCYYRKLASKKSNVSSNVFSSPKKNGLGWGEIDVYTSHELNQTRIYYVQLSDHLNL